MHAKARAAQKEDHQACDNNSDQEQNLDPPEAAVAEKTNGFIVSGDDIAAGDDLCQPESDAHGREGNEPVVKFFITDHKSVERADQSANANRDQNRNQDVPRIRIFERMQINSADHAGKRRGAADRQIDFSGQNRHGGADGNNQKHRRVFQNIFNVQRVCKILCGKAEQHADKQNAPENTGNFGEHRRSLLHVASLPSIIKRMISSCAKPFSGSRVSSPVISPSFMV